MISFFSPYRHDFARIAACVPQIEVADPPFNVERTLDLLRQGHRERIALMVFPELGLSAYAIDDLLQQDALLEAVERGIARLVAESVGLFPAFAVGAPLRCDGRLYNAAVVIHDGRVLGVVPKAYLPNYREFYERRHFTPGAGIRGAEISIAGARVPFGTDLLFRSAGSCAFTFHVEICEDMWVPQPPSTAAALAGAEILLNLSASNITIGKAEDRRLLCGSQSFRCIAAYAYSAAGPGESTTDLAWDGHGGIFEDGLRLAETERFPSGSTMAVADVDLGRLRQERMRRVTFGDCGRELAVTPADFRIVPFRLDAPEEALPLRRPVERFPYVPSDPAKLAENCYEAYNIQVQGLAKRLQATRTEKVVIGVSGGLDSTQALLVSCRAMDKLGLPRTNILAYTLPGFATSEGTKGNAWALMRALGVTASEIDIRPAARQMLTDMGHPFAEGRPVYDVTFENVQAGLRTDYLFRLANHHRGIVVGTGDLSELGLGWCTYGVGDQMSHYNVNASVAKTLIQHLIRFVAASGDVDDATARILHAILATEISPELVPQDASGQIQSTEATIGPYALQDFNLYYLTRYGFRPSKIAYLSWHAWKDPEVGAWPPNIPEGARRSYDLAEIKRWLKVFLGRFFTSQFKRTAMPNGPKISSGGSLSPRGDWRAPSDAGPGVWLAELESGVPDTEQD
ncbi:NAD(+) synthase [Microvirga thermotolerans]|uniref:Glutamine-dependent NAD(+) synthetase n=1 Tax=Microvirga thermotolerans TaxID=2651334 RepID=A0A5P9JXS7_9HYPH|nr:NAD(+) synthase [Microvirga thermotolerans]QFU16446.1 NAD(+) synthase [Microvirga thermotolerans]